MKILRTASLGSNFTDYKSVCDTTGHTNTLLTHGRHPCPWNLIKSIFNMHMKT